MSREVKTLPWEIGLEEFSSTDHPTTIERTLKSINSDRLYVNLVSGSYQSGETVLAGLDSKNILIQRPVDWQESIPSAKVFFRDTFKVWNYFQVQITFSTHGIIYTSIPNKIHRLQRRRHFRVSPPVGSKASFRQEEQHFNSVIVNNISAGGILVSADSKGPFPDDQLQLNEIMVKIPSRLNGSGTHMLLPQIGEGNIIRSFTDGLGKRTYFGISFSENLEVKDEISKYVIQREQEILRHNLKSTK